MVWNRICQDENLEKQTVQKDLLRNDDDIQSIKIRVPTLYIASWHTYKIE